MVYAPTSNEMVLRCGSDRDRLVSSSQHDLTDSEESGQCDLEKRMKAFHVLGSFIEGLHNQIRSTSTTVFGRDPAPRSDYTVGPVGDVGGGKQGSTCDNKLWVTCRNHGVLVMHTQKRRFMLIKCAGSNHIYMYIHP